MRAISYTMAIFINVIIIHNQFSCHLLKVIGAVQYNKHKI